MHEALGSLHTLHARFGFFVGAVTPIETLLQLYLLPPAENGVIWMHIGYPGMRDYRAG